MLRKLLPVPTCHTRSFCGARLPSPSVVHLGFLENKLQRDLQSTRRVVRVRYNDFAESCTLNRVGSGGVILIVSDKVARCIGQIESLHAKLQLNAFCQSEILEDRKIKMPEGRAIQAVTWRVSDCAESRNNKCGWVKRTRRCWGWTALRGRFGLDALVRRRFR